MIFSVIDTVHILYELLFLYYIIVWIQMADFIKKLLMIILFELVCHVGLFSLPQQIIGACSILNSKSKFKGFKRLLVLGKHKHATLIFFNVQAIAFVKSMIVHCQLHPQDMELNPVLYWNINCALKCDYILLYSDMLQGLCFYHFSHLISTLS